MSLDRPTLDDRTYTDLLAQVRDRIPVYSETWTDHNAHDPGITLLELLAWVAESYGYRLDRETDAHLRKYLSLVGVDPADPVPAEVRLLVDTPGRAAGHELPVGTRLVATRGETDRRFATTEPTWVTDATVARVVVRHDRGRTDQTDANTSDDRRFFPFGERAVEGSALYLGIAGDPFTDAAGDPCPLDVHLVFDETGLPTPATHGDEPVAFEPSVELRWEYCTDHAEWFSDDAWAPFEVLADGTAALYHGGTVRLGPPDGAWDRTGGATVGVLDTPPGPAWIRCRLVTAGYELPPRLDRVALNVLVASHRVVAETTPLTPVDGDGETTTARPNQRFAFPDSPVLDATVVVETDDGERHRWTEVPDFDASAPESRHYVRAATAGTIQFGDGRRGAVPPTGARVVALDYVVGGGRSGNVGSAATWHVEQVPTDDGSDDVASLRGTTVSPLGPATGGDDAESTTDALRRARLARETPVRCVTAADFEAVAARTPGLRVGRTAAWVADAETPDPTTHVVVVPYTVDDPRPEPSPGFLAAVRRHVDTHRLVGERVRVDPPTYVTVRVTVTVQAATGYDAPRVEAAVEDALDAFLDPLTGFDGEGWPFGRAVHQSELYDTVSDVAGVARVDDVTARASGVEAAGGGETVTLPPAALVAPGDHAVTVRTDGRWSP